MSDEIGAGAVMPTLQAVILPTSAMPAVEKVAALAPGFRFHPTDEEIVQYYLKRKASGRPFRFEAVGEIDVYKSEPWELSVHSVIKTRDMEWYFFSPIDKKWDRGSRLNRATKTGFWKSTGKDRPLHHTGQIIGMKKTLVFHTGRSPGGTRTNWVMHEYRLVNGDLEDGGTTQGAYVLCKIFHKSDLGAPNGKQYAPFIEEEWNDDNAPVVSGGKADEEMNMNYHDFAQDAGNENYQDNLSKKPKQSKGLTSSLYLSEDSTSTMQDLFMSKKVKKACAKSLDFPLLEPLGPEGIDLNILPVFYASNVEKSVPPGFLNIISNLENQGVNISMEKENLKIEMMRAQAMIEALMSRVELLQTENEELRKRIEDKDA